MRSLEHGFGAGKEGSLVSCVLQGQYFLQISASSVCSASRAGHELLNLVHLRARSAVHHSGRSGVVTVGVSTFCRAAAAAAADQRAS